MALNKNLGVRGYDKKQAEEELQAKLKSKHKIKDKNVIVVERSGIYKAIGAVIRAILTIFLVIAATMGLMAFIFPEPRAALIKTLAETYYEILGFFLK